MPKTTAAFSFWFIFSIMFFSSNTAEADAILINNPSFENDVLVDGDFIASISGWTISGTGGGTWNINSTPLFWNTAAPDGNQVGFATDASLAGSASISQVLSASLAANSEYTLSVFVGHPTDYVTSYSIDLYAGGNLLATKSGTGPEGSFQLESLTFDSSGSAFIGQQLEIRLYSDSPQTAFDSVSLSVNSVPEPSSLAFAGLSFVLMSLRRKGRTHNEMMRSARTGGLQ